VKIIFYIDKIWSGFFSSPNLILPKDDIALCIKWKFTYYDLEQFRNTSSLIQKVVSIGDHNLSYTAKMDCAMTP